MSDLTGKVALVTGGARGLGAAIARRLAGQGAEVHVVDLAKALAEAGLPSNTLALDLTAPDAEARLAAYVDALPRLDILIANAGAVPPWRRIADLDLAEWDALFALNVRGVALSLKVSAERLAEAQGAAVLTASINGYRAHPRQALYTATKHAVVGLMRAAALDMGADGVRVNAVAPGPILTDALRSRIDARAATGEGPSAEIAIAEMEGAAALGRMATEDDVARAATFLAGPDAHGMTGVCLPIEAGLA